MIAKALGVDCSKKCELLLALSYLKSKEMLLEIAYRVANDAQLSAVKLASAMLSTDESELSELARATLSGAGISLELES